MRLLSPALSNLTDLNLKQFFSIPVQNEDCYHRYYFGTISSLWSPKHFLFTENIAQECVNYSELNEPDRAAHYFSYHTLKCDANLPGAWYRFTGRAGTVMPTKCVPKLHCGTLSPGWLNDKHPAVGEGQVERMVCFTKEDNCCYWYSSVKVRNCGKYFVYKFGQLPASRPFCSLRYCGAGTQGNTSAKRQWWRCCWLIIIIKQRQTQVFSNWVTFSWFN